MWQSATEADLVSEWWCKCSDKNISVCVKQFLKLIHGTNINVIFSSHFPNGFAHLRFDWRSLNYVISCTLFSPIHMETWMWKSWQQSWIIHREQSFDLFHLGQYVFVLDDVFIGGQQDIELPATKLRHEPTAQSRGALPCERKKKTALHSKSAKRNEKVLDEKRDFFSYLVSDFDHRGGPLIKFINPVWQSSGRKKSQVM